MLEIILQSIFYDMILPNSIAGAVSIFVILAFRRLTKRWPKGYVCTLWLLLLAQLLIPPLFHSSFYTVRDLGISHIRETGSLSQNATDNFTAANQRPNANAKSRQADPSAEGGSELQNSIAAKNDFDSINNFDSINDLNTRNNLNTKNDLNSKNELDSKNSDAQNDVAKQSAFLSFFTVWSVRIWIAGVFTLAAYNLSLYLRLKKILKRSHPISKDGYWISEAAFVPFVLPGIPPKIYLPDGLKQTQLESILAHERQHIRNLDPFLKCVALTTLIAYWFHPLVWIAVSVFGGDREMYCDECVLRGKSKAQKLDYSETLLKFAAESNGITFTMNFAKSNTEKRIAHILNVKKPRMAVRLLLTAFICISGLSVLTAKSVEGKTDRSGQEAINRQADNTDSHTDKKTENSTNPSDSRGNASQNMSAYPKNAKKFARHFIQLVRAGDKKSIAKLICFPIRVELNGEKTSIVDEEEFISNYNKIVNKEWKSAIQNAKVDEMFYNYMGYSLGDGKIWFSTQIGKDGYWIYAINNSVEGSFADIAPEAQKAWESLAASNGMTKEEARRWYTRFARDGMCENGYHFRITGCAYGDFDGNGVKDIFVVSSLSPHEIYPESITNAMYVYGYINGNWVYNRGFSDFSIDGFQSFEVQQSKSPGISCTIKYTVDTDKLKEDQYLLEIGTLGYTVSERCLTESERVVQKLAKLPKQKYRQAVSLTKYQSLSEWGKGRVVLLKSMAGADIRVYGYDGKDGSQRGVIVDYKGTYSYFDILWGGWYFEPRIYQGDFDGDSMPEFALVYPHDHGNGISQEGLMILKPHPDHTLSYREMNLDSRFLESQLGPYIKCDKANGKVNIAKNGKTKKIIDLTSSPDYKDCEKPIEILYTTIIRFEVEGSRIKLLTEIQGAPYATLAYLSGITDNTVAFDVFYSPDGFWCELP